MKKIFPSSLIFYMAAGFAMETASQEIIPIPADSTSEWRITRYSIDEVCVNIWNSIYYVCGTTIINGKDYYRICETGEYHQELLQPPGTNCTENFEYEGELLGLIRTESGKVYSYDGWSENLLLDFTLNVGDTMFTYLAPGLIISSIDSVLIGEEYRRRFYFSNGNLGNWMIEGIGHELGLFEPMYIWEGGSTFHCYGENNNPLFGELDCVLNVGQNETNWIKDIVIFPNPATSFITITTQQDETVSEAIIYNHLGQKVLTAKPVNNTVDVSGLKAGVYLIEIKMKERAERAKFVKN